MQPYVYIIRATRPGFQQAPTGAEEDMMGVHFDYLKKLLQDKILLLAGPCLDRAFGLVIFQAESDAAARQIAQDDPSVKAGIMSVEVHPFRISLGGEMLH
jgi:uncharacterized protein